MHWCNDETQGLLLFFQSFPHLVVWLKSVLGRFSKPHCCVARHQVQVDTSTTCRFPGCRAPHEYQGHQHLTNDPNEIFPKGLGRMVFWTRRKS